VRIIPIPPYPLFFTSVSIGEHLNKQTNKKQNKLDIVEYVCNPSTWETKARGQQGQGQPVQHIETLSQKG
jgi:hypothetical protein